MESAGELTAIEKTDLPKRKGIPSFTETMDQFLILAEKALQYNNSGSLGEPTIKFSNQLSIIQKALNGYRIVYNQTRDPPTKHIEKFKEIYKLCRPLLLKGVSLEEFMTWYEDTSLTIAPNPKSRNKLYLTSIFRNCVRMASQIEEQIQKNPDQEDKLSQSQAAVYPEFYMLYLFRMFYHAADPSDQETLISPKIKELEEILKLREDESPEITDGISDFLSLAGELAEEIGISIPSEVKHLKNSQIREVLNKNEIKTAFKSIFSGVDLKDTRNLPHLVEKILNKMKETADTLPEPVQRSLNATVTSETEFNQPNESVDSTAPSI